jgi:hypothetical protein
MISYDLLGNRGQLIRMTQLISGTWLFIGCRYYESSEQLEQNQRWGDKSTMKSTSKGGTPGRTPCEKPTVAARTHRPWPKSDDERLLAYRKKMNMKWEEIYLRFSYRTPGVVKARWYMLQEKVG